MWIDEATAGADASVASGGGMDSAFMGGGDMMPIPSLTGGAGGASGDSTTKGGTVGGAAFDNSGWNVTFGQNSGIESSRSQAEAMQPYLQYALIGAAFLIAWRWLKKKH
jgi:hypothetical protein